MQAEGGVLLVVHANVYEEVVSLLDSAALVDCLS